MATRRDVRHRGAWLIRDCLFRTSPAAPCSGAARPASARWRWSRTAGRARLRRIRSTAAGRAHHRPRAKHVIFCYMSGAGSHVDLFDPKPRLAAEAGKPMPVKIERTQFNNNGNILPSPWAFRRYGQSGTEVSDLFPHMGAWRMSWRSCAR
ncbi:MAG: DUF1501 domain-containing protein [Verrucomicrobiales bacterium]